MALIHLEPLPFRCSSGAVLAFVCDHGPLDRKQVGKITLLGRSATVEVPEGKAAALVAKLDGKIFQERRVRVRVAGLADFAGANHFAELARLLDLEAKAEEEALRQAARSESPGRDGTTLLHLALNDAQYGLGGRLLLTLKRAHAPERFPPNRLQPGAPVLLNQVVSHRRMPSYRGVVYDRDFTSIGVAIEPPDDDLADDATWRLDLASDEVSRLRQQEALRRVAAATKDRLAELRDVMLGDREPECDAPVPIVCSPHLNESQQEAVRFALAAKDVAIIHGPPGTGKTTTVVEVIRQAVARGERVLACAPSNNAVDNLLAMLLEIGLEPVRIGHPARIDEALRDRALDLLVERHPDARQARKFTKEATALFSKADKWSKEKPLPGEKTALRREARDLLKAARAAEILAAEHILDDARIICGTLTGLSSDVLGQRHFDLVVIDEAGQSTEPACWLPVVRGQRLVLAGDHCQLPPTVISTEAADQGLDVSLMERLAEQVPSIAKLLTVQYRMHANIMHFSNAEFYAGQLVAHASVVGHRLCDLPGLIADPLTEQPVRFIDTAGASYDEEREDEGGSRFNPQEANLAVTYARRLLAAGLPAASLGVITPYRAQVRLLRDRLADVPDLEVDSVDGFQGREKEAIIVTFVRSNPEGEIGFLADTRRTNVAFTRARRCLIAIGDSATLANNDFYQRMIETMEALGAMTSVWEEA